MNSKILPILIANLFAAGAAAAAEGLVWDGSTLGVGARGISRTVTNGDAAKLNEYRDLKDSGLIGNIDLLGRSNQYYLNIFGENFARDDLYVNVTGGRYGVFKYQLYDDQLVHNLTMNASTALSGTGGTNLTGAATIPAGTVSRSTPWANTFDYRIKRDKYGANFEFSNRTPWYVRFDANEVKNSGIRPVSGALGTGSSNGFMEFGAPVNYKTQNLSMDAGYSAKTWHVNFNMVGSKFVNNNDQMTFPNPYFKGTDTYLLPPDNNLLKYGVNGVVRQLPLNSTLSGRLTYSKLENSFGVQGTNLYDTTLKGLTSTTTPSSSTYNGNVQTTSGSLAYTSSLTKQLESRLYGNYYHRENKSTAMAYAACTPAASCGGIALSPSNEDVMTNFKKSNLGFDLGYRINPQHKLSGGYDYTKIDRVRDESTNSKDNKVYVEYKNNALDMVSGRVKYQRLQRRSNWFPDITDAPAVTSVNYYFRSFDIANVNQDSFKFVLDATPVPLLDVGVDFTYKKNDYKDTIYGRDKDTRQEYGGNVSYGDPNKLRFSAFADYEEIKSDQNYHSSCGSATAVPPTLSVANCLPSAPTTTAIYNWSSTNKGKNYLFGLNADWAAMERLKVKATYLWTKTSGGVDFSSPNNLGGPTIGGVLMPIQPFVTDNTKKQTFNLKGDYTVDKNWTVTGGYAWERYDYSDDQIKFYNGMYQYYLNMGGTNLNYLNGAFANPQYKVQMLYVMGTYKF